MGAASSDPSFELQGHSTYSDGELTPSEVVWVARRAGVELFALTDHDTVDGLTEASRAADAAGVRFIPGVEITALDPVASDLHICGYLIDQSDQDLGAQLSRSRGDRRHRAQRMAQALEQAGWALDRASLEAHAKAGGTIGRPHLAHAVVSDPRNAQRLAHERLTSDSQFLEAYLIEGRPAFREREAPGIGHAIDLIHGAGGLAVWAHPFWDLRAEAEVLSTLERFAALGLDGVEAFYVTHTRAQTELLVARATELGLLTTGSSDFHGPHHGHFGRFRNFRTYGLPVDLGPLAQ